MNCHEFENNIVPYIDGFIDDNLRQLMDKHRSICTVCARLAKAHSLVMKSLNCPEPVHAPEGLTDRILAAVEQYEWETAAVPSPYQRFGVIAASISAFSSLAALVFFIARYFLKNFTTVVAGIERIGTIDTIIQTSKSSFVMDLILLQDYIQGKVASIQIPAQVIYLLRWAVEPVQIPYLSFSLPVYALISLVVLPFIIIPYFDDSAYSMASKKHKPTI